MSNPNNGSGGSVVGKVLAGAAVVGASIVAAKLINDNKEEIKEGIDNVKEKGSEMVQQVKGDTVDAITKAFEDLKTQIEESEQAKDLNGRVTFIAEGLKKIKESNEDDVSALLAKVKEQVQNLKADFHSSTEKA